MTAREVSVTTAAVVIIGNEILTGKFADENGPYLIRRLRALGCDLVRLVTVPDVVPVIADEVRRCSECADHVITTGGVGPTHDDVTLESVGAAFGAAMYEHPDLVALIDKYGLPRNDASLRMATVPEGTSLVWGTHSSFPVVRVRNVWVFPGVPKLLQVKFEQVAEHFAGATVHTARVYTDETEVELAARLTAVVERHPAVDFGSYPRWGSAEYKVIITLESRDEGALDAARRELESVLSVVQPTT